MNNIDTVHQAIRQGAHVTTDSRKIQPGDIFIALRGENHNGNTFADKAEAAGAAIIVVDDPAYAQGPRRILVPDGLHFLQQLARHHRRFLGIPILGITGTNGKTTTKELCHAVLSTSFRVTATVGNLNNHIGVPLTLLSMTPDTQIGIVEMGANHPGEIADLCTIAEPDLGIITNIGCAHIQGFGSRENILRTKAALYEAVNARRGTLILNADDPTLTGILSRLQPTLQAKTVTYGTSGAFANGTIAQPVPHLVYTLHTHRGDLYIRTRLIGAYNFPNAMAATALALHLGIDPLAIRDAIEAYTPSNMRSQLLTTEHNTIILDAYNANPTSMAAAIDNFRLMPGTAKTLIAGEMRELGPLSDEAHRQLLHQAIQAGIPRVITVGQAFAPVLPEFPSVEHHPDTPALIQHLCQHPIAGQTILVKGSRANQLEQIIQYL